jgi:hypothetical protein
MAWAPSSVLNLRFWRSASGARRAVLKATQTLSLSEAGAKAGLVIAQPRGGDTMGADVAA